MKFSISDKIDSDLCNALTHEFFRCDDAFESFNMVKTLLGKDKTNKHLKYKAYNHYADFVHHYYEFLMGCYQRDHQSTGSPEHQIADAYVTLHINRVLRNRREDLKRGIPDIPNPSKFEYPDIAPTEFASTFRRYRNVVSGHVSYKRSTKMRLSDFYIDYHKYVYLMYLESLSWWGRRKQEYPHLKEMSDFATRILCY